MNLQKTMSGDQLTLIPPLRGDGHGKYKIWIVGNSGMSIIFPLFFVLLLRANTTSLVV